MKPFLRMRGKNLVLTSLTLLLTLSITMVSVAKADPGGTIVFVEPPIGNPEPGQTFTVDIDIFNCSVAYGEGLWSFSFKLLYNDSLINATDVVPGPAIGGKPGYFPAVKDLTVPGRVWYGGTFTALPLLDIPDTETLATISFTALELGTSFLNLTEVDLGVGPSVEPPAELTVIDGDLLVVPEFPETLLASLFLIVTLTATFLGKMVWSRKRKVGFQHTSQ